MIWNEITIIVLHYTSGKYILAYCNVIEIIMEIKFCIIKEK